MRKFFGLLGAFCLAAPAAWGEIAADQAPAPKVPQSVWQVAPNGTATHRQSSLVCPDDVGAFHQTRLTVYDNAGFDVSCNYRGANGWITVYLTRLGSISLADAFADAKQQLVSHEPNAVPLPQSDSKTLGADFLHQTYVEKDGVLWSGIWMTELSGWMFEFRASYKPGAEPEILAEMTELARQAMATAGTHLALCAKSQIPQRDGVANTNTAATLGTVMLFSAFGTEAAIPVQDDKGRKMDPLVPQKPGTWCAENVVEGLEVPILLWHAVTAEGQTQPFDRVTVTTIGASPVLNSRIADVGMLFEELGLGTKTHFAVTMTEGDEIIFYGVYAGRPKPEELARIIKDYVDGRAKPLAKINPKTNTVMVFEDPKK